MVPGFQNDIYSRYICVCIYIYITFMLYKYIVNKFIIYIYIY